MPKVKVILPFYVQPEDGGEKERFDPPTELDAESHAAKTGALLGRVEPIPAKKGSPKKRRSAKVSESDS